MTHQKVINHVVFPALTEQKTIQVVVTYATPACHWSVHVTIAASACVVDAIHTSQFLTEFQEFKLENLVTGIYGKRASLTQKLNDGDRVEIYRALTFDPKQSRRRRALHRQKIRNIKKKMPINDVTI